MASGGKGAGGGSVRSAGGTQFLESDNPVIQLPNTDPNYGQMLARPDPDIVDTRITMREQLKLKRSQQSTPGLWVSAFEITPSDWDAETDWQTLMQDYTRMRNGDSFVSSSVDVLLNPILNAEWMFKAGLKYGESEPTPIAEEAKDYIQYCFDNLYNGKDSYLRHLVLAYWFGLQIFEKVWEKGEKYNGKWTNRLVKISPIQADTLRRVYYDFTGELVGMQFWKRLPNFGSRLLDMTKEQMHIFTPFEEFGNVLGRSLLRPIRMVWDHKTKVWRATARAASRGAGIPVATLAQGVKDTDTVLGQKIQTLVQTMGNAENAGMVEHEGIVKFRMEELKNQNNNIEIINLANSEIVYNTLTHFIISGIGQSGSRAATESHKAPYLEALDVYFHQCQDSTNDLIRVMIENSPYYGKLETIEYPSVILERNKELDLSKLASSIQSLVTAGGLKLTAEDQVYFRKTFGLPEKTLEQIQQQIAEGQAQAQAIAQGNNNAPTETPTKKDEAAPVDKANDTVPPTPAPDAKSPDYEQYNKDVAMIPQRTLEKIPARMNDNKKVPDAKMQTTIHGMSKTYKPEHMADAVKFLDKHDEQIRKTVSKHYSAMLDHAKHSLKIDRMNPVKIPDGMKQAMYNDIADHYNNAYEKGYEHSKKQIGRMKGNNLLEKVQNLVMLANMKAKGPINFSDSKKKLQYSIDGMVGSIEGLVNKSMLAANDTTIDNAGGVDEYVDDLMGNNLKGVQSSIVNNAEGGFIDGSNDAATDYENEAGVELLKTYTTQAETRNKPENVCEVCYPYEGMTFTRQEAEDLGLNWDNTSNINPECLGLLGGNECRCSWYIEGVQDSAEQGMGY